jgi:hypothetical protein
MEEGGTLKQNTWENIYHQILLHFMNSGWLNVSVLSIWGKFKAKATICEKYGFRIF